MLCHQNNSLRTEEGTVSNAAPDICIVYKLHLECGRLINLYDWLEVRCTAPCYFMPTGSSLTVRIMFTVASVYT